jgi:hypothetical protein
MQKIALIPTKEKKSRPIQTYLENAGWAVHYLEGKTSIFQAYSDGVGELNLKAKDRIIMCHDDIEILTDPKVFNQLLDSYFEKPYLGFVGVAGAKKLNQTACWWHGVGGEYPGPNAKLCGAVFHGSSLEDIHPTYYGSFGKAEVMDGLFLATTGRTLHSIQLKKPSFFKGNWDFYDIFYTYQASQKNLNNYVVPIQVLHYSFGEGSNQSTWEDNRKAFIENVAKKLAPSQAPHPNLLPR